MLKKVFKNKGDGHAKKEILAAVEERMGLKCEYAKDDAVCRVCTQECECERKRTSPKQKGREGSKDCDKCRETLNHVMMAQCNQTTRILKEELIEKFAKLVQKVLKPWEIEQMQWIEKGGIDKVTKNAVTKYEVETKIMGDDDKWVHSKRVGKKWEPWDSEPFHTSDGMLDVGIMQKANEKGQYPRKTSHNAWKVWWQREEDVRRSDGTMDREAWKGKNNMAALYVRMMRQAEQRETDTIECMRVTENVLRSAPVRSGPVWSGLMHQITKLQEGVPHAIGTEAVWGWDENCGVIDAPMGWYALLPRKDSAML